MWISFYKQFDMVLSIIQIFLLMGCVSCMDDGYFTAAVLENKYAHEELTGVETKDEIIAANLRVYEKAAEVAASKGTDIIIFSEYGLFPYNEKRSGNKAFAEIIPDPKKVNANPCNESDAFRFSPILVTVSCMAQRHGMYIVVNMLDRQPCNAVENVCNATTSKGCLRCPKDKVFLFNTNVVFDRQGNMIAKYYKNHLWFENVDTPLPFDAVTFKTEFGIMGLVICFDTVFHKAVELVKKYGADTIISPTYWFDDILPLRSVEWQQSWALAKRVNFLTADGHHPDTGTVGSGIYAKGHGALVYTYSPDGQTRLLVARVPRGNSTVTTDDSSRFIIDVDDLSVFQERDQDGDEFPDYCYLKKMGPAKTFDDYRCNKSQFLEYSLKKLTVVDGRAKVCNRRLCCTVVYSADRMDEDYYLAAFNGTNNARNGFYKWAEEDCFVIRCDPFEGRPCVLTPKKARTVFKSIELRAVFTATASVFPTVSKQNFRLAPTSEFRVKKKGMTTVLTYSSDSSTPLLKAGLLARVYERDPAFVVIE